LGQDLQGHTAELWILDDAGQIPSQSGGPEGQRWHVISEAERYPTLPAKYTRLVELARPIADAYVVWDDDDVYLPWHVAVHARTLDPDIGADVSGNRWASRPAEAWSHPREVLSTAGRRSLDEPPAIEASASRFHGSLAIRRDCLDTLGGWIQTDRATFDQEMIGALIRHSKAGNPCEIHPPSYVYRWGDTGRHHCSGVMNRPDWYQLTPIQEPGIVEDFGPQYDDSTRRLLDILT